MSEAPAEQSAGPTEAAPTVSATTVVEQPQEGTQEQETFDADYVKGLRREAATYRSQAKAAASELEKVRKATMSETERLVADAEQRGRQAATVEFGRDRARARFDTLAAKRNPEADTDSIIEFLDLTKFVDEDGRVNDKALTAAVERLVPQVEQNRNVDFDGGGRESAQAVNMDTLIRRQSGHST